MVRMVEQAFALSEASNMPAILELRIRACHVRGSFECKDNVAPAISTRTLHRGAGAVRLQRAGASAGHVPAREAEGRRAHAGGAPLHRRAWPERDLRRSRTATSASIVQGGLYNIADPRAAAARAGRRASAPATIPLLVLNVDLSAGARADRARSAPASARCWWSRKASPSSSSRRSRRCCAARDIADAAARQGPAAGGRRVHGRGASRAACCAFCGRYAAASIADAAAPRWLDGNRAARARRAAQLGAPLPARPPQLLHRLPRAAGVRGAEARAARDRHGAHRGRHRLPCVRDLRAVLARATRSSATA